MKFKKGDRVRFVKHDPKYPYEVDDVKIGELGTVRYGDGVWPWEVGVRWNSGKSIGCVYHEWQLEHVGKEVNMDFKVGDRVRITNLLDEPTTCGYTYGDEGIISTIGIGNDITTHPGGPYAQLRNLNGFYGGAPYLKNLELIERPGSHEQHSRIYSEFANLTKPKKGGVMSLLKKMLKPDDALIEKYCMDEDGDLEWDNCFVQQALLDTDGFKTNLVALLKEKEKEAKKK